MVLGVSSTLGVSHVMCSINVWYLLTFYLLIGLVTDHCPSVLWCCGLGRVMRTLKSSPKWPISCVEWYVKPYYTYTYVEFFQVFQGPESPGKPTGSLNIHVNLPFCTLLSSWNDQFEACWVYLCKYIYTLQSFSFVLFRWIIIITSGGTPSGEHSHLHNWTPFK